MITKCGLDVFINDQKHQEKIKGAVGYLCHSASVTENLTIGVTELKKIFGDRLIKLFGPQHGFVSDVQDNMIETSDYIHPFFKIKVHSLYGKTRVPTQEMLEGLDTLIVDLQDVGTRVYTYITTLALCMEACEKAGVKVVVFDRPNPVGGEIIEGSLLEEKWRSFVGHHPIPMRHALTMAEVGLLTKKLFTPNCEYDFVPMENWNRSMNWEDTHRIWVNPSPNLPTPNSALVFCGSVLFEGTNISEGRGTTRSLEVMGAPGIDPYQYEKEIQDIFKLFQIEGVIIRPLVFQPTFQKHAGTPCGGFHLHVTDSSKFKSWRAGQVLLQWFYHHKEFTFQWNDQPYEYQFENLAIDFINGNSQLREWVENNGNLDELIEIETLDFEDYKKLKNEIHIY